MLHKQRAQPGALAMAVMEEERDVVHNGLPRRTTRDGVRARSCKQHPPPPISVPYALKVFALILIHTARTPLQSESSEVTLGELVAH